MDCTCNYSEPVYVASTKSGDVLQIYDLSNQVKMYLNGQSITLFVRLMLEGRMIQMYKLENR